MFIVDNFKAAMANSGLFPPEQINEDGKLHRCGGVDRPRGDSAWYVYHGDGVPAGCYGDWRTGFTQTWCSKSPDTMTEAEKLAHRERVQAMQRQREVEQAQRHEQAAQEAARRWAAAAPYAGGHQYLERKKAQLYGVKVEGETMLVPMRDTGGKLWSLQTISRSGDKLFMPGGRVRGTYFSLGRPEGTVVICEGVATAASIFEATGMAVAAAFSAGNLLEVAKALREKFSDLKVILAADDDHRTPNNPGLTKARAAAMAVGGWLAVPEFFGHDRQDQHSDFNDLHQLAGPEAVKACFDGAVLVVAEGGAAPVAGEQVGAWPEPTPLPESLPPVAPFDAELLPVALRAWVMDIAHRMQCPADFSAAGAIAALSSLIGARAVIRPKERDDWQVVPNLWALIVGRPGVMKSPALGEVMKPLNRLEAVEREQWQAVHDSWELDCKVSKIQAEEDAKKAKGHISKGNTAAARELLAPSETPAEPVARSFVETNTTVEALGVTLQQNPWGLIVYRDEIYSFLTTLDREENQEARGFYLQGYDGIQGYKFKRIIRGETWLDRVCIAMLGGIQPGKIERYVRDAVAGGNGDDGLLQRFGLTVWPDVVGEFQYVDQWPDTPARQTAYAVFERLAQLQPATDKEPVVWRFSPEAQALFVEWLVPFETEIRGDDLHPAMVSHLAKYRKLVPALALVFALVDTPDSGGIVHETELLRALAWSDYLRSHANRLYAAAGVPEATGAASLLAKIKGGKLTDRDGNALDSFTPRLVALKHWSGLTTPDEVRRAANVLADYDYLRREVQSSSDSLGRGRPSDRYQINPVLLKGGAA